MTNFVRFLGFSCLLYSIQGQEVCSRTCKVSYPLHTVDKVAELQACTKGCRLQLISYLSGRKEPCNGDCSAAYKDSSSNEINACVMGCEEQKSINQKVKTLEIEETTGMTFQFRILYPIFSARDYYHSWLNKDSAPVQSTYFVEQSASDGKGNSMYMRLEMYPGSPRQFQIQHEIKQDSSSPSSVNHYVHQIHGKAIKWLNCVEMKAGVPYPTLVAILFMSLAMVTWICCSTCDDAEDETEDKKHTFGGEGGLSIMADELLVQDRGDLKVFTISNSDMAGPLPEKERLLQV